MIKIYAFLKVQHTLELLCVIESCYMHISCLNVLDDLVHPRCKTEHLTFQFLFNI